MIDDALQTSAVHLLGRPHGFDSSEGLVGWVIKVAWNEVQMEWRRRSRAQPGEVPERADGPDPAVVVERRLDLDDVANGLAALSDAEREAILSPLVSEGEPSGPLSAAVKMRRHRARQHLLVLMAGRGSGRLQPPR